MRGRGWSALLVAAGLLGGGLFALNQTVQPPPSLSPLPRVMDRRCRGGCTSTGPLLSILPGGPTSGQIATGAPLTTAKGGAVTVTQAGAVTCQKSDLTWSTLTANQPCVEPTGLAVRPSTLNTVDYGSTFDPSKWTADGVTVAANNVLGPDGAMSGTTITETTTTANHRLYFGNWNPQGSGWYSWCVFAKPGTDSFGRVDIGGSGPSSVIYDLGTGQIAATTTSFYISSAYTTYPSIQPAANGYYRICVTTNDPLGPGAAVIYMGSTAVQANQGSYAGASNTLIVSSPQLSYQQSIPAYIPSNITSGVTTRAADTVTVANPLGNADASWCVRVRARPDGATWDQGVVRGLWQIGTTNGAANTAALSVSASAVPAFTVVDSTGSAKTCTATTSVWAGARVLRACDAAGTLSLSMDGTALTCTTTGTGSGQITTQPGTIYVGSLGAGTQLGGTVSDVCVDNTASGCPSSPALRSTFQSQSLAAIGDSLTGPTKGTSGALANVDMWPDLLGVALPSWVVANYGKGSQQIVYHTTNYHAVVKPARTWQYVTFESGINDVLQVPIAEIFSDFKRLWDEIDASGSKVVVLRESPWANSPSWSTTAQSNYDSLQSSILNWCNSTGHKCFDFYTSALSNGATPPALACAYDYDTDGLGNVCTGAAANGVHLNQSGQNYKLSRVRSLLGI